MDAVEPEKVLLPDEQLNKLVETFQFFGIGLMILTNGPYEFTKKAADVLVGSQNFCRIVGSEELLAEVGEVKPS